ncbi:MAG: hypothetical protein JWR77_704, partial [Rhizorhabdus sp.]|nr:hypothetical protein [Rhizorhabdus sp.]
MAFPETDAQEADMPAADTAPAASPKGL